MDTIIIILVAIAIIGTLLKIISDRLSSGDENDYSSVYEAVDCILTKAEMNFYDTLYEVCFDLDVTLYTKVRLADIVKVKTKENYMAYFNKIKSKHIDFVICDNSTLKPLICLELDDSSHNRKDRIERDQFIDDVFNSIGYEIIHIPCRSKYDKKEIKSKIVTALEK